MGQNDQVNYGATQSFCASRGIHPGKRFRAEIRGRIRSCVFSRIGATGYMICHEEGEPDMQSSWTWSPEDYIRKTI